MSRAAFIEPCLPSSADKPPAGSNWIHEIKHDGFRLMARRDPVGIRLITRNGHDWEARYPLVVEAMNHLKLRSCLIDGEVVCCDEKGVAAFQMLRHRRNEPKAFLYAFDLLELNGADLRREPIEVRKATLASILRKSRPGVRLNEHMELVVLTDVDSRTCVYTCEQEFSDTSERPEDQEMDGSGLRFETLAHGGEFADKMPQAIRATDRKGRSSLYVPITVDGRVVDSKGFTLKQPTAGQPPSP
jgi:bifunctional non-homologous end joining protein LigD